MGRKYFRVPRPWGVREGAGEAMQESDIVNQTDTFQSLANQPGCGTKISHLHSENFLNFSILSYLPSSSLI